MKSKDIKSLHQKNINELVKQKQDLEAQLVKISLEKKSKPEKNSRRTRIIKDDLARVLTIIRQLQIKEQKKI